ncbi:YndM family protein [Oceanobacillus saliphilus]|uniref:YndM family protein n=1 Tax=Oceanobacillus saliphilus TaxID=2925834 RepID=UPI00201D664D|nr:YndM family protein [Oceanobacillus saliphilus]
MRHLKALGIKFTVIAIVLYSILPLFLTAGLGEIFFMSVLLTGVTYIIGDLFILPRLGYFSATVADFVLVTFLVWILSVLFIGTGPAIFASALSVGFGVALTEAIFHIYMKEKVLTDTELDKGFYRAHMQTEIAEEEDIHALNNKVKRDEND